MSRGCFAPPNGGQSWQQIDLSAYLNFSDQPSALTFIDNKTGFVRASQQNLMKTTDGGLTWRRIVVGPLGGSVYKILFVDGKTGYMVTSDGLLKTTDTGETWIRVTNFPALKADLTGASSRQSTLVLVGRPTNTYVGAGGRVIIRSDDAGQTFQYVSNNLTNKYANVSVSRRPNRLRSGLRQL